MADVVESFVPLANPAYSARLMEHLQSRIETVPRDKGWSYKPVRLADLIHPQSWWAWEDIKDRKKLHKFAEHVRSSQVFAVNLFGALPEHGITEILSSFFGPMRSVERPVFEFEDPQDRLRESLQKGQQTQVDILLRGRTSRNEEVALLVEVKLSEVDFGVCSGAKDDKNDTLHLCSTKGAFGSDPQNCFKLRNHGGTERRLYDQYLDLGSVSEPSPFDGCSFRESAYQPMRNVALAGMLQAVDGVRALVAVCAPLLHRKMWEHFHDSRKVLPPGTLWPLPAEVVLSLHDEDSHKFLRDHYFLDVGCQTSERDRLELATWQILREFDERFDHPFQIFETHPGGGQYDCITLFNIERLPRSPADRVDLNRDGRIHVFREDGTDHTIDDGWERALAGNAGAIASEIAAILNLRPRQTREQSPWNFFERTIALGSRAGETLRWRNFTEERQPGPEHSDLLGHWTLQRVGSKYDEVELRMLFEGQQNSN